MIAGYVFSLKHDLIFLSSSLLTCQTEGSQSHSQMESLSGKGWCGCPLCANCLSEIPGMIEDADAGRQHRSSVYLFPWVLPLISFLSLWKPLVTRQQLMLFSVLTLLPCHQGLMKSKRCSKIEDLVMPVMSGHLWGTLTCSAERLAVTWHHLVR